MRVFTVNKNKGWRAGRLAGYYAGMHPALIFILFFGVGGGGPLAGSIQPRNMTTAACCHSDIRVNYVLGAYTQQGWPQQCVWRHVEYTCVKSGEERRVNEVCLDYLSLSIYNKKYLNTLLWKQFLCCVFQQVIYIFVIYTRHTVHDCY